MSRQCNRACIQPLEINNKQVRSEVKKKLKSILWCESATEHPTDVKYSNEKTPKGNIGMHDACTTDHK